MSTMTTILPLLRQLGLARATTPSRTRRRRPPDEPPVLRRDDLPAEGAEVAAPGDDGPAPCGWFDSSHDLRSGLLVDEVEAGEALARVVPLDWWLQWECSVQRGGAL